MKTLVFLLEERSMKEALQGLLPRVLPEDLRVILVPHEGKSDLEKSIPRKLRGWRVPDTWFVVMRDQDSGDCRQVKARLQDLCAEGGREDSMVRVVCRELESWFLGDLQAVEDALDVPVARLQGHTKFRNPDALGSPSQELLAIVPSYSKVRGARAIGPRLNPEENRSTSFEVFVAGVRRLAAQVQG